MVGIESGFQMPKFIEKLSECLNRTIANIPSDSFISVAVQSPPDPQLLFFDLQNATPHQTEQQ